MQIPTSPPKGYKYAVVDLKLRDGKIIPKVAIDESGTLLGNVIGGHDGVDTKPLGFCQSDIVAFRPCFGLAARFGLAGWRTVNP